jgi:hypothetical protein
LDGLYLRSRLKKSFQELVERFYGVKVRIDLRPSGIAAVLHVNRIFHKKGSGTLQFTTTSLLGMSGVLRIAENVFEPDDVEIVDLHLAVDLVGYGIDFMRRSVTVDGKGLTSQVRGTLYFGGRNSDRQICIYDKAAERQAKKLQPIASVLTRLEIRYRRSSLPARTLSELTALSNFNPFERVAFTEPRGPNLATLNGMAFLRSAGAHCCLVHQGMPQAELKKRLGRNGRRCLKSALGTVPMMSAPDLKTIFQGSFSNWLAR